MPKMRPYSSQSCINYLDFPTAENVAAWWGGGSVPLIPSIVERVRSGPERSRARRFLARRSATLDGEDRCETITEGRKEPSSNSAYPLQSLNSLKVRRRPNQVVQVGGWIFTSICSRLLNSIGPAVLDW